MTNFLSIALALSYSLTVLAANSCININTAPEEELEKISHIGPTRAAQIVRLRKEKLFSSIEEINRIKGIGPKRISDIAQQGLACASNDIAASSAPTPVAAPSLAKIKPENPSYPVLSFLPASVVAAFSGMGILLLKKKLIY